MGGLYKMSIPWNKGKQHSAETRLKMSEARRGKEPWNKGKKTGIKPWLGRKREDISGERSYKWKGDAVGYRALHGWVDKRLGKPQCCDMCGVTKRGRYHWANKSGSYKREITDWIRLCPKCHYQYDNNEEVRNNYLHGKEQNEAN